MIGKVTKWEEIKTSLIKDFSPKIHKELTQPCNKTTNRADRKIHKWQIST